MDAKKTRVHYDEIGWWAQNILTILGSVVITQLGGPMWSLQKRILTLTSYNFYISTQTLELEMTVCAIHRTCWSKETISDLIQWLKQCAKLIVWFDLQSGEKYKHTITSGSHTFKGDLGEAWGASGTAPEYDFHSLSMTSKFHLNSDCFLNVNWRICSEKLASTVASKFLLWSMRRLKR